ncbi:MULTISPECIES: PEP-CTERM sorting domain-containing protein [Acidobacteriaceae]|uniref:PEP-CTERM sorting domain-containing protein n=1 Tax=Acidobacteriaceae TaxID=204434 RepID=UPI00131D4881|nr:MULTISPECIES: PEP-CTERM sorting domain-containing protein [Acidobacteriaceae]MDW5264862.1 PEP-CTERM sorting domain-containing protein [Edaphobacter sp.]
MQIFKWSASIAIAVVLLVLSSTAYADTYEIFDLGGDNGQHIQGIDASGAVVLLDIFDGYYSVYNGVAGSPSTTDPGLTYDNGTPCSPVLSAGMSVLGRASCNNGHEVFGGYYLDVSKGLYTGPDPADFLQSGSVDALVLNSAGDFAWSDGAFEENYLAIDLSSQAPEPDSILLLSTGLLAAVGMRRRLFS